jgi:ATP-dependent RNA helicase DDX24/MAK5
VLACFSDNLASQAAIAEGRDVIGAAATGSGKTLAFGLPILHALACERTPAAAAAAADGRPPPRTALAALVLCPTRELALQVSAHLTALGRGAGVRVAAIVGGIAPEKQARMLSRGPAIVVGTPGRLWELVSAGAEHFVELHRLRFLVLDEADRMVEKGHFAELRHIMDSVETRRADMGPAAGDGDGGGRAKRQTFVFSATLTVPPALRKRLRLSGPAPAAGPRARQAGAVGALLETVPFCGASAPLVADVTDATRAVAPRLEEAALEGSMEERDAFLVYLLTRHAGRAIVFCNAISTVRRVAAILATLRLPCAALHAAQQQRQRLAALDRFRDDATCALVATDVAARGLDVAGVRTVIHYQVPASAELYVHRSGRTARAAADGLAVTLVTPGERTRYSALCRALGHPQGLPPFPLEPAAMAAARRRAAVAAKLDATRHARDKRRGDDAWMRKHAAELEIELSDEEFDAGDDDGEGGGVAKRGAAPSKRERELQAQLDALLAQPLGARLGTPNATGSRRFPTFRPAAVEGDAQAPTRDPATGKKKRGAASAAAAAATEGQDALAAVRAKQRSDAQRKKPRSE